MSSNTPGTSSSDSQHPQAATLSATPNQSESPAPSAVGDPTSSSAPQQHYLRKRPAAANPKQQQDSSTTTVTSPSLSGPTSTSGHSKLRKVLTPSSSGAPSRPDASSSFALPLTQSDNAGGDIDLSNSETPSSSSTVVKKKRELNHLADYFPAPSADSGGRLTRSRTRAMASNFKSNAPGPSSSSVPSSSNTSASKSIFAQGRDKITKKGRDLLKKAQASEAKKERERQKANDDAELAAIIAAELESRVVYGDDILGEGYGSMDGVSASSGSVPPASSVGSSVSPIDHLLEPSAGGSARTTPYVPGANHANRGRGGNASASQLLRNSAAHVGESSGSMASSASQGENTTPGSSNPSGSGNAGQGMSRSAQRASSFLSGLVPRMQHLLATSGGSVNHQGIAQIRLRSTNDICQTEATTELAQMLLMGNEESLPSLPIREIVQQLILLMQKENSLELTLLAVRCVSNMQEALPRSMPLLVECVPTLLQKLKHIECIDIAEQTLLALEALSRRHAKSILHAGGFSDAVMHVDFFSMPSQRLVYQIAANCASHITVNDFASIRSCLPDLTQKLIFDDKRCCESICTFFNRLIENCSRSPERLRDIAGKNYEFLSKVQQLLTIQPSSLTSVTFVGLLKSVQLMCMRCTDIVSALINMEFARTLRFLLVGNDRKDGTVDVTRRAPQHTREIVSLIGELLPPLPKLELFEICANVTQYMLNAIPVNVATGAVAPNAVVGPAVASRAGDGMSVVWQYSSNDLGTMIDLNSTETTVLELARTQGDPEAVLNIDAVDYYFDLNVMEYTNSQTGFIGRVDRRLVTIDGNTNEGEATRDVAKEKHNKHLIDMVCMLFPLLVEIGSATSCSNLRYDSTRVMIHMMYAVESETELKTILSNLPLASYIASTLSSNRNQCVTVSALQLVHVMLDKLPRFYVPLFESEGVFHMIRKLIRGPPKPKSETNSPATKVINLRRGPIEVSGAPGSSTSTALRSATSSAPGSSTSTAPGSSASTAPGSSASTPPECNDLPSTSAASTSTSSTPQSNATDSSNSSAPALNVQVPLVASSSRPSSSRDTHISNFDLPIGYHFAGQGASVNSAQYSNFSLMEFSRLPTTGQRVVTNNRRQQPPGLTGAPVILSHPISSEFANMLYRQSDQRGASPGFYTNQPMTTAQSALSIASSYKHVLTDRITNWITKEAKHIISSYHAKDSVYDLDRTVVNELSRVSKLLAASTDVGTEPLEALKTLLLTRDISSFQLSHSNLTRNLAKYLADDTPTGHLPSRDERLQRFCKIFIGLESDNIRPYDPSGDVFAPFDLLVHKVVNAVGQLEQFQIKITNLSAMMSGTINGSTSSSTALRGSQALRFFQTHQIRCNLKRHPSCKQLREWRHGRGSIKVDPFTSISAIERYLVDRGIGHNTSESSSDNEDDTEDDIGPGDVGGMPFTGRIEILINDHRVPSELSILQAICQYSGHQHDDNDTISPNIWVNAHNLYFRVATTEVDPKENSSRVGRKPKKASTTSKNKPLIYTTGMPPVRNNLLKPFLTTELAVKLIDPCVDSCILLRILYGLNTYWYCLYNDVLPSTHAPILPSTSFHSSKLNAKVQRQLSDFLSVATQQIPRWTTHIIRAVPFMFPFAVRRHLLYCTSFGRDRAVLHIVTQGGDESDSEATRLLPRFERRRIAVKRHDLLTDAVNAFLHTPAHRAQIEVSFEDEVGTGFGPTLEFYSTISKELQKHEYGLWNGVPQPFALNEGGNVEHYTTADNGLYPRAINRVVSKPAKGDERLRRFEFMGRLLAQALLDSRMLDIPFSPIFFKWLLNDEENIGPSDLESIDATIYKSLRSLTQENADDIACLEQVFTMPGDDNFELIKNGKNESLTKDNVKRFIDIVIYWRLVEGVRDEMYAFRRGFDAIVDSNVLKIFTADEMEGLFCGSSESSSEVERIWSRSSLQAALRPDHGYTHESPQVLWLVDMLHGFSLEDRRKFLQFCTGSPRLPIGGFRGLNPPLTVVRKTGAFGSGDGELPSAMTCYNFLKIPAYATYESFVERFQVALQFIYSFHLT